LLDFVSRFHLRAHSPSHARVVASVVALTLVCACRRSPSERAGKDEPPAAERTAAVLAQVPADAAMVLSLDLDRLRGQTAWATLLSTLAKGARPSLDGFAVGTRIDLTRQLHRVTIALPAGIQGDDRLALIADVDVPDEARATTWLRTRLGENTAVLVRGGNQIVMSQGAWKMDMSTLSSAGKLAVSAADTPELRRLCMRAAPDHSLWFAAVVPAAVRRNLMQEPRFPDVAAITRVWGSVDLADGLAGGARAELIAELSSTADASELAYRLGVYLNQAKRHPDMLVRGLAPYLEAVRLTAHDARVHATLDLSGTQLDECIERIEALAHATWTK
jgi:hypothetical protein